MHRDTVDFTNNAARSDRVNLKGCRIGDVAMRGCSRGCCPYPDDKVGSPNQKLTLHSHFRYLKISDITSLDNLHQAISSAPPHTY